jgi:hypothetical protein
MSRGHWPLGKRRNSVDPEQLAAALAALAVVLDTRYCRGLVSLRALADHLGVSDRSVRRWLSGEDYPPARVLRRIETWTNRANRDGRN